MNIRWSRLRVCARFQIPELYERFHYAKFSEGLDAAEMATFHGPKTDFWSPIAPYLIFTDALPGYLAQKWNPIAL